MTNLNKTYHKGKFRSGEWAKHLRPYLKRLGNKKFRKAALTLEEDQFFNSKRSKRKRSKKRIKIKVTIKYWENTIVSYYKSYRTLKDMQNAINRPNVIRYQILSNDYDKCSKTK